MPTETREVRPAPLPRHVLTSAGALLAVPEHWSLLPPGDPALSRRIKRDGPSWTMIELRGGKRFSHGIWAPAARLEALRAELLTERENPAYQKKIEAGRQRRAVAQEIYAGDFRTAVFRFLNFHARHRRDATALAGFIAAHATPVGSGTVARTKRIPLEQRAEAATIAWLRHQTTGYDRMVIPRETGSRREVRFMMAERSRQLLARYRSGQPADAHCPLQAALKKEASYADPLGDGDWF